MTSGGHFQARLWFYKKTPNDVSWIYTDTAKTYQLGYSVTLMKNCSM